MPEILTKYPNAVYIVLKSAGAKCGEGLKPHILKNCPEEQFCVLPEGELCVYDIKNISQMTQVTPTDVTDIVSSVPTIYGNLNIILLMASCLFGILFGMWLKRK